MLAFTFRKKIATQDFVLTIKYDSSSKLKMPKVNTEEYFNNSENRCVIDKDTYSVHLSIFVSNTLTNDVSHWRISLETYKVLRLNKYCSVCQIPEHINITYITVEGYFAIAEYYCVMVEDSSNNDQTIFSHLSNP